MSVTIHQLRNTTHIKTAVQLDKLGRSGAEICFIGRSNVGKSSLINTLCTKKDMAHCSSVPGKTRTINVYEVIPGRWLVDLPGYGFAVGGSTTKDELGEIIESYLNDREALEMVYLVIDAVAGPTKLDLMMHNWLLQYGFPYTVVVNKIDKIPLPKLDKRKEEIIKSLGHQFQPIFWVSTSKKSGITDLQHHVVECLTPSKQ